jgi:hypothetical protein
MFNWLFKKENSPKESKPKEDKIEFNTFYKVQNKDPFALITYAEPIAIQDGYVQYYIVYEGVRQGRPSSCEIDTFMRVYKKESK